MTGEGRGECGGKDFPSVCSCRDPGVVRTGSGEGRGDDLGASWTCHCLPLKELWLGQMPDGISLTDVLDISAVIISGSGYLSPRQLSTNAPCGSLPTAPHRELRLCPANYLQVLLIPEGSRGWDRETSLSQSLFISQSTTIEEPFQGKCLFHSL